MAVYLLFALLLILTATAEGQDPLCGTKGHFCPEDFDIQKNSSQCGGKYSEIFSDPGMGNSSQVDDSVYLNEVLQSKAYELYSEQKGNFS